jgi:hypothetical protein
MTVKVLPGVRYGDLIRALDQLIDQANDARSGDVLEIHVKYLRWATEAARSLSAMTGHDDVARLILTRRHWAILALPVPEYLPASLSVQLELEQRVQELRATRDMLAAQVASWSSLTDLGHIVVPDTNLFLHHKDELPDIDWADILQTRGFESIHVAIPLIVIDELDRAKRTAATKSRARSTLKNLDAMAMRPGQPFALGQSSQDGTVDVRILAEDAEHVRHADPDMEIVDAAQALQDLTGGRVSLLTFDTGMVVRVRSRSHPLNVVKLGQDQRSDA